MIAFSTKRAALIFGKIVAGLTVVLAAPALWASPDFTLRGFGTLGAAHNFSDGAESIRDISQPDGPRNETSFDMDSRLGLQLDVRFTPRLSSSLQAVSRYNYRGKYSPELSLATLKYEGNDFQARVGRVGWDVYSMSDSRDVGYSFLWVRPPLEYFGKLQIDWFDGADFRISRLVGEGLLSAKVYGGFASQKVALDELSYVDQDGTIVYGGHLEYYIREWMFRLGVTRVNSKTDFGGELGHQLDALVQFGDPALVAFLRELGLISPEIDVDLMSGAVVYDRGPFQLQLMVSYDDFRNLASTDATLRGFVTASYRTGDWTPYVTYAHSRTNRGIAPSRLGGVDIGDLGEDQYSISAGVRYDFHKNFALKAQFDHFEVDESGRGAVLWRSVQENWNGRVNQLSLTLDFIF